MFLDAGAKRLCFLLGGSYVRLRIAEIHSPGQVRPIFLFEIRARNGRNFLVPIRFPRHADCDSVGGTPLQQCHRGGCSSVLTGYRSLQDHGRIHVFRRGIPRKKEITTPMKEAHNQQGERANQPQLPVRLFARFVLLVDVDQCVSQCAPPARGLGGRQAPKTQRIRSSVLRGHGKSRDQ